MDVRNLKYPEDYFDLIIDKSTIDALLCGERSFINVAIMFKEVQRVLKEGGVYMIISYGQPQNRIFHLEREHLSFDINIYTIKKDYSAGDGLQKFEKIHYVYICKKKKDADNISLTNFEKVIDELEADEKIEEDYLKNKNEKVLSGKNNGEAEDSDQELYYDDQDDSDFGDDYITEEVNEN